MEITYKINDIIMDGYFNELNVTRKREILIFYFNKFNFV